MGASFLIGVRNLEEVNGLEVIQGDVRSEPLNRNFSYIESKAQQAAEDVEGVNFKKFKLGEAIPTYLFDLQLQEATVNQALAIDEQNNYMFATQVSPSNPESFRINRLGMGGKHIDSMNIKNGGHGTTIMVEPVGSNTYIWATVTEYDSSNKRTNNVFVRFPYQAGREVDANSSIMKRYGEYPDPQIYMSPFGDYKNDLIAFRHTNTKIGTITHIEIRRLSDVKNNVDEVLYDFPFTSNLNDQIMQGFALDGTQIYLGMGQTVEDFNIYRIEAKTGEILEEILNVDVRNPKGGYDENFGEPEGLFLYTDPTTNLKTLMSVVVMGGAGKRRSKVFGFSNNFGLNKFVGQSLDNTQQIKFTLDTGRGKGYDTTRLSDIREPGNYYFTGAQMDEMKDHPEPSYGGGWWLEIPATDIGKAVIQRMTRNSTGTPHKFERVVSTDGTASVWRRTLGENVTLFSGDSSGDYTSTFKLSESLNEFDMVYIRLNSEAGTMAVTKTIVMRDLVSDDIIFSFSNISDTGGSTDFTVYEVAITMNSDRDGFKMKRANKIDVDTNSGKATRSNNISTTGVARIIGIRL